MSKDIDADPPDIVLTDEVWAHICRRHPELALCREEILETASAPQVITPDRNLDRMRFYRAGPGPSRWLAVVVDLSEVPPRIVTAHGFRKERPR